jgi:hypothetical protein
MRTTDEPKNSSMFTLMNMSGDKYKRSKQLDNSWATYFRDNILPILPMDQIEQLYCENNGRPTKELCALTGTLILQRYFDFTDYQTCFMLSASIAWQTALNITNPTDKTCYISPRTLWDFHNKIAKSGFYKSIFNTITIILVKHNDINFERQRLDSTRFKSNIKKLSR